ncbi:hypothetical protein EDD18DRAFT_1374787 [Armillaria luteobubalina]|uniref:Uncharacterized protein n=1 Tax=Armillaria luteobubalina TaxID=153913 RepID=A0AA39U2P4_9AGAR|nr:hypothetical protein EDD18DRAFT_1374787 [Armillaria luteobubalina]
MRRRESKELIAMKETHDETVVHPWIFPLCSTTSSSHVLESAIVVGWLAWVEGVPSRLSLKSIPTHREFVGPHTGTTFPALISRQRVWTMASWMERWDVCVYSRNVEDVLSGLLVTSRYECAAPPVVEVVFELQASICAPRMFITYQPGIVLGWHCESTVEPRELQNIEQDLGFKVGWTVPVIPSSSTIAMSTQMHQCPRRHPAATMVHESTSTAWTPSPTVDIIPLLRLGLRDDVAAIRTDTSLTTMVWQQEIMLRMMPRRDENLNGMWRREDGDEDGLPGRLTAFGSVEGKVLSVAGAHRVEACYIASSKFGALHDSTAMTK